VSEQPQGSAPPGWYPDGSGQQRWWTGSEWGQAAPGQPVPGQASSAPASSTDPKTLAMLAQLLGIFTGFLGPLVIYLMNGDKDPFVRHHSAEALNFQITLFIAYMVSAVLILVLIGLVLLPVIWIVSLVFMIQATIAANRGEWYRYPVNLRLVPGAVG
jgi:uncharacterized Tic20 family protein